ncbi:MAG TPA: exonuclease SbcCD subunit D [Longimicrobiales bacterium]|nr:exonuclease SbcCD subunit D [Longimicrobiales bacterium]
MRFVHVADVHLDTSFPGRSESVRKRLREASREAFRAAVDLAVREDVQAFVVAGDLFDSERLSFSTERFLLDQAHRLGAQGITLVYATGNHDPGSPETGPRPLAWPPNVHVVADGTPRRIAVADHDGRHVGFVTAVGHATPREREDLSRRLPRPQGELPEVALLHTQVHATPGSEAHHAYAPSELTFLTRAGFDYWALGHVHIRQLLSEDPPVVYPGSLQGRTHTDTGPRGAYLVDLTDRSAPSLSFRSMARVRWETLRVGGLHDADSLDRLERKVALAWRALRDREASPAATEWMVRVALEGPTPLWKELRREEDRELLAREVRELLGVLDVTVLADSVHPVVAVEEHRKRTDVLGEALRLLEAVRRGEERLPDLDAAALGGTPLEDPRVVDRYVRQLLEGADGELAARLLGLDRTTP